LLGISDAPDAEHPSWRLSLLDPDHAGRWAWSTADEPMLRQIVDFLSQMERLTWAEIRAQVHSGGHRKHHAIPVGQLCPEARQRLRHLRLDDLDELFEFRLGSKRRLWGFIANGVFYPVWWDEHHQVYPVEPG
jgi:hypothetical protein